MNASHVNQCKAFNADADSWRRHLCPFDVNISNNECILKIQKDKRMYLFY